MIILFLLACGGADVVETKKIVVTKPIDTAIAKKELKEMKHDTDCIRIFLSDMKLQQQQPIENWNQPSFEAYEDTACSETLRPKIGK